MSDRVGRLRERLEEPLLVSNLVNIRYLTGFKSSNAALLVEPDRTRLFTDFRYAEAAGQVEGVKFTETRRNVYGQLPELLSGRIAFEATSLTYDRWETLTTGGLELVPTRGVVEELREVKDAEELAAIRRAAELTNQVYAWLAEQPFVGRTELDLARAIEARYLELGAENLAFEPVVAAGANGALPHADPGDHVIPVGTTVVVDTGCLIEGYSSDCTRTFATGELPEELARGYEVCLRAQEAGLAATAVGAKGIDVDRVARNMIEVEGFGEAFGHGLGHGIGLEVHEGPYLSRESTGVLRNGNVVTVEPGIYLSGLGGIRIEGQVIVRDTGLEVLNTFPKTLVTVG
jgi:Xaa-Pro aminopeptidase